MEVNRPVSRSIEGWEEGFVVLIYTAVSTVSHHSLVRARLPIDGRLTTQKMPTVKGGLTVEDSASK